MSIESIRPSPSDEEAAAIVAAVDSAWPQAQPAPPAPHSGSGWRFSGRWWRGATAPRRQRPER